MLRRAIKRLLRVEPLVSLAQQIWAFAHQVGLVALIGSILAPLVALAVGWWTATRAWAEGVITSYGTLGYVATILTVALMAALVFFLFAHGALALSRRRTRGGDEKVRLPPDACGLRR